MSDIYSGLKALHWYVKDGGLPQVPKQVAVSWSDTCNQDCFFCAFRSSGSPENQHFADGELLKVGTNNPKRMIPTDRALSLVGEIADAGVLALQSTGGGEPTAHPGHEAIFERILERKLKAALVSNGVKWSPYLINKILPNFTWVRVSIDAGRPETYAAIRRVPESQWFLAWRHINALVHRISEVGSTCTVGVGFVVTPSNWSEIALAAKATQEAGAHYLRIIPEFTTANEKRFDGYVKPIKNLIQFAKAEYPGIAIYDQFDARHEDLIAARPDYKLCAYSRYNIFIGGDQKAYMCCGQAYNDRGFIAGGDLSNKRFDQWWFSDERKKHYEEFDARGCETCRFHSKQRIIAALERGKPSHMEFA